MYNTYILLVPTQFNFCTVGFPIDLSQRSNFFMLMQFCQLRKKSDLYPLRTWFLGIKDLQVLAVVPDHCVQDGGDAETGADERDDEGAHALVVVHQTRGLLAAAGAPDPAAHV